MPSEITRTFDPYIALTGTAEDVVIRGENLTRTPVTGVRFGAHAALAANSRRAYTYDNDGTVRVFDVSAAAVGTFPEVLPAITLAEGPGTASVYRILASHDEQALFIAGSEQVVVVPLP